MDDQTFYATARYGCNGVTGYQEIIAALVYFLGDDWRDCFYPEYPESLIPWSPAFHTMLDYLKSGATQAEMFEHPIYGFWVNLWVENDKPRDIAGFCRFMGVPYPDEDVTATN